MNKDLHIPDCCGGGQQGDPAREPVYCSNTSRSWTREAWCKDREDSVLQTSRAWKMSLKPRVQMSARETSAYSHSLHALNRIPAKCSGEPGIVNKDRPASLSNLSHGTFKRRFVCFWFLSHNVLASFMSTWHKLDSILEEGISGEKTPYQTRLWGSLSWWLMWKTQAHYGESYSWLAVLGTCVFLIWDTLWEVRTYVSIISFVSILPNESIIISLINIS